MKKIVIIILISFGFSYLSFAQEGQTWVKKNYSTNGSWSIQSIDGKNYLVLGSDFKTSKGPDLKIFFTNKTANAISKNQAVEKFGVFIAKLKSNKGDQKYPLPSNLSINDYKSIVIHCEAYTKVWSATNI